MKQRDQGTFLKMLKKCATGGHLRGAFTDPSSCFQSPRKSPLVPLYVLAQLCSVIEKLACFFAICGFMYIQLLVIYMKVFLVMYISQNIF